MKKMWKRFKKHLVKVLSDDETSQQKGPEAAQTSLETQQQTKLHQQQIAAENAWREAQQTMEAQATGGPQQGLNCPECQAKIPITMQTLLSGESIVCANCGLELTVDQEQSKASLDELKKLNDALTKAEQIQKSATAR